MLVARYVVQMLVLASSYRYHISPNIRPVFFKYCLVENMGRYIFGPLRINVKVMIIRSSNC
jgi:hypothetical protein